MKDHEPTGRITRVRFCQNPSHPPYQADWFLVDQAKCPDALKTLFETEQRPQYDLPYLYSGFSEQAYHGPLLIEPVGEGCRAWLERWLAKGKALALYGRNLSVETVRDHWVSLNWITTPTGEGFFRYADPASFAGVGPSLSPHQCQRLLGPHTAIEGCHAGVRWSLERYDSDNSVTSVGADPGTFQFTSNNVAAIEAYRRRLLAHSLAEQHQLPPQLLEDWFSQLTSLGASTEKALVEASELLITAGCTALIGDQLKETLRCAGDAWSDRIEALADMDDLQEGP
ncbi:MAG TPA: DUF4123 domain-containing protein [Marinobacter sp.]|nr:DUF4123 domain-containing protein [Marinobacter sp.]